MSRPIAAALLIAIGMLRMAATFRTFSATTDEATHVAAGLEIYQRHHYGLQMFNPPLPRLVMAAAPYMSGIRLTGDDFVTLTHSVFYNQFSYERNLFLARLGNLVFFALAAAALWILTKREIGEDEALLAVLLFTTQPVILGYSALATHDAAGVAALAVALVAFSAWLRNPDWRRAILLAIAYGISVLCKFSSIPFVPAACAALYIVHVIVHKESRKIPLTLLIVPPIAFLMVWIGYGFNIQPFYEGLRGIVALDRRGMSSYLFGEWRTTGWWWYFPAGVALKTTLPVLALFITGFFITRRRALFLAYALAIVAILAITARSRLDIGMRYVLPIYIPLSIAAAMTAADLLRNPRAIIRRCTMALIALQIVISIAAHPDYFPYFNALAGPDPSRYLIDSNLDWEQDALRLRAVVRELKIERLAVRGASSVDYGALGFPPLDRFDDPHIPKHGWIAVGDSFYRMERNTGGWSWLRGQPFRRVGKSIRLFHVP
jgi:4-amino-4-deoxy-L-arabinose transferase-like glycosyltransferase